MNSGSLGHGLSLCVGMALAAKMDGKAYRVYTVMGDGELEEMFRQADPHTYHIISHYHY
jgi:transketolase N-terminal domain/subunit